MLLGKPQKIQCPVCSKILLKSTYLSGNTFGMKLWSDGKKICPMLPDIFHITKCNNCEFIFWLDEIQELDDSEENNYNIDDNNDDTIDNYIKPLKLQDFLSILNTSKIRDIEDEKYIRIMIWQLMNDKIRPIDQIKSYREVFNDEDEVTYFDNLHKLSKILDIRDEDERIQLAEIMRNMGKFNKASELLMTLDDQYDWLKQKLLSEIDKNNPFVILIV